jgi:gamma-glutamylcyclotransferase (GGCT)/AIG2-like uncharacterized protein YtfP
MKSTQLRKQIGNRELANLHHTMDASKSTIMGEVYRLRKLLREACDQLEKYETKKTKK